MPKICGVYRIISPSGSFYIGSSINTQSRWRGHKSELRNNRHHCQPLQRAAHKYGIDALRFELLVECSPDEARELEQAAIDIFKPEYNSSQSTLEALSGLWRNPVFRAAGVSRASAQINALWQNPDFVEKQRAAASACLRELHRRPEFKAQHAERIRERILVVNSTPELKAKAAASRNARYESDPVLRASRIQIGKELMAKMRANSALMQSLNEGNRERMKRMRADPAARAKNAAACKALSRPVLCIETETRYPSAEDAAASLGVSSQGIRRAARGERKSAFGYSWRYV